MNEKFDELAKGLAQSVRLLAPLQSKHQRLDLWQFEELPGRSHSHLPIAYSVEMPMRGVDRDEVVGLCPNRAFQEPVVWFVADDAQFGKRMTQPAQDSNFS